MGGTSHGFIRRGHSEMKTMTPIGMGTNDRKMISAGPSGAITIESEDLLNNRDEDDDFENKDNPDYEHDPHGNSFGEGRRGSSSSSGSQSGIMASGGG